MKSGALFPVIWSISVSLIMPIGNLAAAGLLLEKEYPWSTSISKIESFASEHSRTTNESGYKAYFIDPKGKRFGVEKALIVRIITFPDAADSQNITNETSLASLQSKKEELQAAATKVPVTSPYLAPQIASLENQIAKFKSGARKVNGTWLEPNEYAQVQVKVAAAQAAEKKRLAEERAAEAKRHAEQEAIAQKQLEEHKAAERQREEKRKNADADLARSQKRFEILEGRASQSYETAEKGTLSGQVFISTRGGQSFKLGAVEVALFSRDAIDVLVAGLKGCAAIKTDELRQPILSAKAAYEHAEEAERTSFDEYLKAIGSSDSSAKEATHRTLQQNADSARDYYFEITRQGIHYSSGAFYFDFLRSPIHTVETDPDGKFLIEVPKNGTFVIAARATRSIGDQTERYYWLTSVSLGGQSARIQNLSNNNLTSTPGTSSLISTND
jgi:hypothetical protein